MQSLTDPYWTPPPLYMFAGIRTVNHKENDLGFRNALVPNMPVTTGQYYGSNEAELNPQKKLVTTGQGEYFAPGNYVPSTGGRPLVNIYDPIYTFKRDDYVRYV